MYVCLHVCMYTTCVLCACVGQKRVFDALELELHTDGCGMSCKCWDLNQGLYKSSKCF